MRLLPFPGRVKFRSLLGFGLHVPADVEGGPADPIGTPAPAPTSQTTHEGDQQPAAARDQPVAQGVPPLERSLPFLLEATDGEPGGREHGGVEVLARLESGEQRRRACPVGFRRASSVTAEVASA